ncbi:hypothetical protein NEUTE1DRAFT_101302 [Neurospora tetrasperma FGSC 2508]|uniref:Uncharacterized protein n=1 Tax=Neurospora tetrasperma (strain FGSC 2508 / ATCC MYA-4615 / P0657) TaxID=510951 RepID=F8MLW4_NEUT8|nr:uncharacterized protein NEUTE1DRAFT_101302 [Neurospora tetrasperma FGSC 2508]EGO58479.1 hypothetical protein NEUTE1DRAFT_101302 [Neurospora tetrasperma FGSC 2508]EGZ71185.1 hypothetical protein NEUTE2DRAFT_128582 [Neurospora tetrasperma FGSC 2509]
MFDIEEQTHGALDIVTHLPSGNLPCCLAVTRVQFPQGFNLVESAFGAHRTVAIAVLTRYAKGTGQQGDKSPAVPFLQKRRTNHG